MLKPLFLFLCSMGFSLGGLTKEEAAKLVKQEFEKLSASRELEMKEEREGFMSFKITAAEKTMKCVGKLYGEAKSGERRLFISMHGGGGAPARVNDQQWNNQLQLYVPKEGWYVAPRAPTNTWNLWHEEHIDGLFSKLIEEMVAKYGVDPNKIYLMGYSAGGDGVYQLAPRLADRFAAATMMAGHPNGVSPDGLYNLPFRIYMGGKDKAYKRNKIAAEWKVKLAKLQKERGGYEHKVTIYPEEGHWMKKKDAESVPWMAGKTRNPWPKKVIWGKSRTRSERFYWLGGKPTGMIEAEVKGQEITITGAGYNELEIYLSDELLDLNQAVKVMVNGRVIYDRVASRRASSIKESLGARLDPTMAASAILYQGMAWLDTKTVAVRGLVKAPGQRSWTEGVTVETLIASGGGFINKDRDYRLGLIRGMKKLTFRSSDETRMQMKVYPCDLLVVEKVKSPE